MNWQIEGKNMTKPKAPNTKKQKPNSQEAHSPIYFGKQKGESLEEFISRVTSQLQQRNTPKTL